MQSSSALSSAFPEYQGQVSDPSLDQFPEVLPDSLGKIIDFGSYGEGALYALLTDFLHLNSQYTTHISELSQQTPLLRSPLATLIETHGVLLVKNCPKQFFFLLYLIKVLQAYDLHVDVSYLITLSFDDLRKKLDWAKEMDNRAPDYAEQSIGEVSRYDVTPIQRSSHRGLHHHYFGPVKSFFHGRPTQSHPYAALWTDDEYDLSGPETLFVETRAALTTVFSGFLHSLPENIESQYPFYRHGIVSVRQALTKLVGMSSEAPLFEILAQVFVVDEYLEHAGAPVLNEYSNAALGQHLLALKEQRKALSIHLPPGHLCLFSNRTVLHGRLSGHQHSRKALSAFIL